MAAFSGGLAQDSSNAQLLSGLIEAAMKSPLRGMSLQDQRKYLLLLFIILLYIRHIFQPPWSLFSIN